MARGIDYSPPGHVVNRDPETGIRYGIIHNHKLVEHAFDEFEAQYILGCPKCGEEWPDDLERGMHELKQTLGTAWGTICPKCETFVRDGDEYSDEPSDHVHDDGVLKARIDSNGDAWVFKSPFYTRAEFCSPCAPGACSLSSPCDDGERAYCFGHDWFDGGRAPYPVYSVETDALVEPTTKES